MESRIAFTPKQLAEMLPETSEQWVLTHIKKGNIPSFRIGTRYFIPYKWVYDTTKRPKALEEIRKGLHRDCC